MNRDEPIIFPLRTRRLEPTGAHMMACDGLLHITNRLIPAVWCLRCDYTDDGAYISM